jgi:uncharacterized protein (TIGR00730 family)
MKRICVFCGSNFGARPAYAQATRQLAAALVEANLGLVFGGARVGLMGLISDSVRELGGEVIGVMPHYLVDKEIADRRLNDLRIVNSMHERKALMAELSDGFIALPGGLGTLEEFFEVVTWAQLEMHNKPCGLLDVEDYYSHLSSFLDHAVEEQLIRAEHRAIVLRDESPRALLQKMFDYQPPRVEKWMNRE